MSISNLYRLQTPKNYSENSNCWEVVWNGIFMPFDIICGLDGCPPDNNNYEDFKKTHWWVCAKTKRDYSNVHDISMFIKIPAAKEFEKIEDAINYCLEWRKNWLTNELNKQIGDSNIDEEEDTGSYCCGKRMSLAPSEIVYECLVCGHWEYASS